MTTLKENDYIRKSGLNWRYYIPIVEKVIKWMKEKGTYTIDPEKYGEYMISLFNEINKYFAIIQHAPRERQKDMLETFASMRIYEYQIPTVISDVDLGRMGQTSRTYCHLILDLNFGEDKN